MNVNSVFLNLEKNEEKKKEIKDITDKYFTTKKIHEKIVEIFQTLITKSENISKSNISLKEIEEILDKNDILKFCEIRDILLN